MRSCHRSAASLLLYLAAGYPVGGAAQDNTPAVAVVSDTAWAFQWGDRDRGVSDLNQCLESHLAAAGHVVIEQRKFLLAAFPTLPPEQAPTSPQYLELALGAHDVTERLKRLNVEHIVYVTGVIDAEKDIRDMKTYCGLVGNVPVCAGGIVYEQTHWLKATILGVANNSVLAESRADETGRSWGIHAGYFPIGNGADTESVACNELAKAVSKRLRRDVENDEE